MPDAHVAATAQTPPAKPVTELKVSGHLMTLDTGLFCIVHTPARALDVQSGLPGVRISLPPGPQGRPEVISIATFRPDNFLIGGGDAALVRVLSGPAQILVTIYQAPDVAEGMAPNLQVIRLLEPGPGPGVRQQAPGAPAAAAPAAPAAAAQPVPAGPRKQMDAVAHIQSRGDVGAMLGEWLGEKGSKRWIEGFAVSPTGDDIKAADLEYQGVLGRGWLSPWVEGGQFCGSRGMALPLLGLRLRLRGPAADTHELFYSATFVDGTEVGPVKGGEACEAESLAPLESFHIEVHARGAAKRGAKAKHAEAEAKDAAKPAAKAPKHR
jgi:hypothetical protein